MSKVSKQHYKKGSYQKSRRAAVDVNLKGFLCSCNHREKDCVKESYNILNKYADVLWPPAEPKGDEELEVELNQLRTQQPESRRFQVVESGAKNFVFIKTTVEDPVKLAQKIVEEIADNKSQETRFLLRLVPIEITCKAYLKDIEKSFESIALKYFTKEPTTFSVIYNHRNNNNLNRDEVIKQLAAIVSKIGLDHKLEHKVDLKNANLSIICEIVRGFAFMAVVPHYLKYKKYNLLAFVDQ